MGTELTREAILQLIQENPLSGITNGELSRWVKDGAGEYHLLMQSSNVQILHGLSSKVIDIVDKLMIDELIHMHSVRMQSHVFALVTNCSIPRLPEGVNPPTGGYKKPRWVQVVLYPKSKCRQGDLAFKECPFYRQDKRKKRKPKK